MRNLAAKLMIACVSLSFVQTQAASAQDVDSRAALEQTFVKAQACRNAFGSDWDPIVADGLSNLEIFLIEDDPTIPKVELDVILGELFAEGDAMPITDELRDHCRQVMASGS